MRQSLSSTPTWWPCSRSSWGKRWWRRRCTRRGCSPRHSPTTTWCGTRSRRDSACTTGAWWGPPSLRGANAVQEEPISVVPNKHLERRRCPLIVGIRGGTQALSCGTGPEPQLKLEEVGLLDLFLRGAEATPYTFYKTFGGSTHTFEAAAFPGFFLSTAPGPGEALTLAAPHAITAFYLRRK
ncbi:interleukin-36 receptor antagonist protein-like isoform X2 [Egretta garzetta]|uniref:interleukin-36 receptor antagonist protein-like isoform X2 n=1 Tax=Egretta garzetta TaxID=188379 RepID=UPI00163CECC5|nr:interleukin-36 receptor antagonist protein-like isoform X2 [Egretta garzetta]